MKNIYGILAFSLFILLAACKKENENNVLIINPGKVTSYARKDWNSISFEFKTKKDYQYTELNNGNTLAAITMPARDPDAPATNYTLLFNIDQQKRVSAVVLNTTDSLDVATGDKLFLYYYEHSMGLLTGVTYTFAIDSYDNQVNIPVEQLLTKLRTLQWHEAALNLTNSQVDMQAGLYHGGFSFILY